LIVFNREIPKIIKLLEALLRRLPANHPKRPEIENELSNYQAGYKGEQSIDYYLNFLPDQNFLILHGLRIPFKNYFFQMDTLLLSKSFLLIIEVKNLAGTLLFDDVFKQLIRTKDSGEKEIFKDPLQQVKLQQYQLFHWLKEHKYTPIPLEHLVIMTNPKALLQTNNANSEYVQKVIPSSRLVNKIHELQAIHKEEKLQKKELRKLSRELIKNHVPASPNILEAYEISKEELMTGVFCNECNTKMIRKAGKWFCPSCLTISTKAHMDALQDFSLLIDSTITSQQFRNYLHINSRTSAHRLIKSLNIKPLGSKRKRKYMLNFDEW
jgi:rubrerythrin